MFFLRLLLALMIAVSLGFAAATFARWIADTHSMVLEIAKYLRDLAQTCTRLARTCPHSATSRGLEEIAIDLMAKAKELEDFQPN
jgi:hypothetical protein